MGNGSASSPEHQDLSASNLAAIVEASEDAIISKTLEGHVLTWNAAAERIYGYTAAEAKGQAMTFLLPADRGDEEAEILEQIRRGIRVEHFETVRVRKDGKEIDVSITISPVRSADGTIVGASHIARDITERKRLEERFRETQKLESLGVLAGGVAHDFNNLLTGIIGNTSLALDQLSTLHAAREPLRCALDASERAADLIRQLLAYAGKGRYVVEPVCVSELIREICELIQSSIPRTVQLRLQLPDDLPPVDADTNQIRLLIMNLVINGAEAVGEDRNGTVTVTTGVEDVDPDSILNRFGPKQEIPPGRYVSVRVQDTGCGMDGATVARIFEPFFTTKFTGRGLGLAAVQGIVRGHKGAMRVESVPGKGSTFQVLFPVRKPGTADFGRPGAEPGSGAQTVLFIDDEQIVRQTAKSMLERYGYRVFLAENGKDGVDLFRIIADRISLVILDMTMPVMSGEETLRHLKRIQPEVRVLLSSGYNAADAVRRFAGTGLAGFVQKPYSAVQLAHSVRAALLMQGPGL